MKQKNKNNLVNYNKNKKIYKDKKFKVLQLLKQLSIIYNLLIFSKKRFKNDFTNFPSNLFFIILLPLLGYTLDKQKFLSTNINNFESFFYKTLPGLNNFNKINLSNLTWETFNYTEYFKKINWNNLKQLSYFDSSVFISFNSNLYNKKFYISTYNSFSNKIELNINNINIEKSKNLNKYFISGRNFSTFFKPYLFNKNHFVSLDNKNNYNNLIVKDDYCKNNDFLNLKYWQYSFYELDNIPLKLNNIFYSYTNYDNNTHTKKNNLTEKRKSKNIYLTQPLFNNLFYYKKFNSIKKSNLVFSKNFKTIIEKKNNILNFEIGNKKVTSNIYNFRFFHYKIYNKLFLFKNFLKYQINDFDNNKLSTSFYDFIITKNHLFDKKIKKSISLTDNKFISILKTKKEPNWKNLIRKDLKNLGSTKNKNFIYYNKFITKNFNNNNNLSNLLLVNPLSIQKQVEQKEEKLPSFLNTTFYFKKHIIENNEILKNKIKTPISIQSRENKNAIIKKNNNFINKINDKNIKLKSFKIKNQQSNFLSFGSYLTKIPRNKKYSFLYYFEREFFYYLELLTQKNKSKINTSFYNYNNNILCFIFNNKNNYLLNNLNEETVIKGNFNSTYYKNIILLKNKIFESNSNLLKRKVSGYLYPDTQKKNIIFINKLDLFNNSFIQIKGPKNLIYNKFKNFSNNLFFLYNKKSSVSFNIEELNFNKKSNLYLKNKKNLTKNLNFFGNKTMDFGLGFSYNKNNILETVEIDKSNYHPNLSLIYSKQRLDSKSPFSWQYPIKEDLLLNNNNYFHSLVVNKKKNNYNLKKRSTNKNKLYDINKNYLLEVCDFNEIPLLPISYKSYFKYNKNYNNLNIYYSNFIKNFNNLFNTDLYELVSFKQWSLLTQISFLLIFLNFINNLKENYGEFFLTAFKTFFNNFEFDALMNFKIEVGKTIKSKKIKFNNLVGGKFFLQEFNQTILLLRNFKFGIQSSFNIRKPDFNFNKNLLNEENFFLYSNNNKYKNSFILFNSKQKNSLFNFINNPLYLLYPKHKKIKSKKKNSTFAFDYSKGLSKVKNLQNQIYIKGFLLVGPPGTGKTVLVKALSGEAEVPIVLESGEKLSKFSSSNDTISENAKGALELKNLFKRAKKISPCILFLDEIDSVGQNRKDVLVDYRKKILINSSTTNSYYFLSNNKININSTNFNKSDYKINNNLSFNKFNYIKNNNYLDLKTNSNNGQLNSKSLSMLTQLLCELDGLKDRCDLVIIGATNRPKTLDPALTRPGRLSKIVYIDLPGKQKRFELLKFYSKNKQDNINWEFFANQTTGLSAADLSSSLNISLLKTIYNYINLEKKQNLKLVTNFNVKNKLIPDFEEIEYGIQIIKFRNNSFKYKSYELGVLINSLIINYNYFNQIKLISLFDFSKFILNYKKFNFIKTTNAKKKWLNLKIKKNKRSRLKQISRTIFYKKNRKFIRSLYLLNKKGHVNKLIIDKKQKDYFINKFNKYINRLFKVSIFSSRILLFSTYIINNPLTLSFNLFYNYSKNLLHYKLYYFNNKVNKLNINNDLVFDKNFINFKYNNILKYKIINYNFKLTNSIVLINNKKFYYENNKIFSLNKTSNNKFIENNFNTTKPYLNTKNYFTLYNKVSLKKQSRIQQFLFSDSSFINRISYYIGGKALILTVLKKPISNVNTINLWSVKNKLNFKTKKKLFIENSIKKLINKEDFENYLFFIINGKISEIKMLLDTNSKNFSNFAIDDLKELSWLLNIMINKNNFYKTLKSNLLKQALIQNSKSSFKKNNKQIIKNNYNETQLYLLINKFDKSFLLNKKTWLNFNSQKFNFWSIIPYWWEPNLKLKNPNIMHWSFKKSKKINSLNLLIKQSSKYYYFSNNYNNNSNNFLINNNFIICNNNRFLSSNKISNSNFINKVFEPEIKWNNILIIEYYILISNLIFNLIFNCFNLLELNIEFVDYLIYYILCNERFYDFELNKLSLKYYYFKSN
uniref:ATP-dependent zinc metalloprotease FtsH n=1 Tax=Ulva compressa TaxID=63659 RepID=A0A7I6J1C6_ULVCO|nr:ATP-dependent zinc metalloprotease FtsH [Ulva compressa]ARO34841.1 ATP-dependent zinc metalloprotease FtsH [Ulva compressa]